MRMTAFCLSLCSIDCGAFPQRHDVEFIHAEGLETKSHGREQGMANVHSRITELSG